MGTTIAEIPDDCLAMIVRLLNNWEDLNAFSLTCQRWLRVDSSTRGSLRLRCIYTPEASEDYIKYLPRLLARFTHLSSISLAGCTKLTDHGLASLSLNGSRLQALCLDLCLGLTDSGVADISAGCPNLTYISLYRCNITDTGLRVLAESCKSLEHVNLSCTTVTDTGLEALSSGCPSLTTLVITSCTGIRGYGLRHCGELALLEADSCRFSPEGLAHAVSGGSLEYLNLSSPRGWTGGDQLGSIGLRCSSLRYLNLRLCRFVGDESVCAIAKGCTRLKEWNLGVCHGVGVLGWRAIGTDCLNLEILHVNRCRGLCDVGLRALRDGCKRLSVLHISWCRQVTNAGLESFKLARGGVEVRRIESVTLLGLNELLCERKRLASCAP
ncbi:F-box/LRR-repeat protein 12 [Amborella trichopoda]|uniref:F-box domain-containing protein n=1 Tax=Amborella trichopoda TaxID=13333 RepID=U5DFK7_AMBTC|nr:F-box/LRR-repeat protein 12 [Amborella trichopoda]ERN20242.1 hypothetical protein AMTR_s00066p00154930 [Amborella trichopoda]|eukprot:XP_006858775.1 F-box/LRR-repeat protein 12 [Amborella trichopoda]